MVRGTSRPTVVSTLGFAQILGWGTSFYLPAVMAPAIAAETGWSLGMVVGGASAGLLTAGLASPRVGRVIEAKGGRLVLASASVSFAAGLALMGLAPTFPVYLASWILVGLAMSMGLYDAVFATLARLYGEQARSAIATVTLFGGFGGTVCWPLSALLMQAWGWRGACLVYAAVHLLIALPAILRVVPAAPSTGLTGQAGAAGTPSSARPRHETAILLLLGTALTIIAGIGSIVLVHLLIFLQARGLSPVEAVAIATLFGPAQVGARLVERIFGSRYHPFWTLAAAGALMAFGLLLLATAAPILALAVCLYAAGYGISWIARGTVPLAVFGAQRFPRIMGRLAFPSLIGQALAPVLGAWWVEHRGVDEMLIGLAAAALLNLLLIFWAWRVCRQLRA